MTAAHHQQAVSVLAPLQWSITRCCGARWMWIFGMGTCGSTPSGMSASNHTSTMYLTHQHTCTPSMEHRMGTTSRTLDTCIMVSQGKWRWRAARQHH